MRNAFAVLCVGWIFTFAGGVIRPLLPIEQRDTATTVLAAAALGAGIASLLPLFAIIVLPGAPVFAITFAASVAIWLAGRIAAVGTNATPRPRRSTPPRQRLGPSGLLAVLTVLCAVAILFDAAYWPFDVGDALALYAPFAKHLYLTRTLPAAHGGYEAYPMLLPMLFAFTHWAAGSVNEYVARLVPAAIAVGALGASAVLGRDLATPATGIVTAALIVMTPLFGRWATTGYTDVPAAFYVTLTALFAWRWWCRGDPRTLTLCGLMAGLAMWTKNSTLTLLPGLLFLVLARPSLQPEPLSRRWRDLGILALAVGATAGAWYLRNLLAFGFVVPPTLLTDRAHHTVGALGIMLRPDQQFGVSGWLFTAALAYAPVTVVRRGRSAARWHVLLALTIPFLAAWWWFASYEARFLVTIAPLLAAMTALMLGDAAAAIQRTLSPGLVRVASAAAMVVAVAAFGVSLRKIVEHKAVLVRHPFLGDADRHRIRLGGLYDLALALNALPRGSRVAGVPSIIGYHVDSNRFAELAWDRTPSDSDALHEFDYVVYASGRRLPSLNQSPMLHTVDGYELAAVSSPPR
jgi:hypothetical protein